MMRRSSQIFFIVFFVFASGIAFCDPAFPEKTFPRWTSYTNSNEIKDLILDRETLWSAGGGVTKLDLEKGERVKYLKEHGLASNDALKMTLLQNTLWIGTANGITRYDRKGNKWKSFHQDDGLPDEAITAITSDPVHHDIWFGSWEGYVYRYQASMNTWDLFPTGMKYLDQIISSLTMDTHRHTLWIGTWGKGLYSYSVASGLLVKQDLVDGPLMDYITALLFEDKKLWVGTVENGLFVMDLGTVPIQGERIQTPFRHRITDIKAHPGGNHILVSTMGGGLMIYEKETRRWQTFTTKEKLPTDRLSALTCDGKRIFLGSEEEGVIQFDLKSREFKQYKASNEMAHNRVSAVAADIKTNRIWIGTEGNGAASFEVHSGRWRILNVSNGVLPSDVVNSISVESGNGTVWVGTDEGLVRYEPTHGKYVRYGMEDGLSNNLVYASDFDHQNRLWTAFFIGSPAVYNAQKNKWRILHEIPGRICHALLIDKKSQVVWMATDQGVLSYSMRTRKVKSYWPHIEFRSVYVHPERKEVWAGSWEKGLFTLNLRSGRQQEVKELKGLSILDIQYDPWSTLIWFATNQGVFSFDQRKGKWETFDVKKGLGLNYVLSIGISKDSIWFGTWGGGLSQLSK